jgi:hypothetical protein
MNATPINKSVLATNAATETGLTRVAPDIFWPRHYNSPGSNDRCDFGTESATENMLTNGTLVAESWVRPTLGSAMALWAKGESDAGWHIYITADNSVRIIAHRDTENMIYETATNVVADGEWQLITVEYTHDPHSLKIMCRTNQSDTAYESLETEQEGSGDFDDDSSLVLRFGLRADNGRDYQGDIGEVTLYKDITTYARGHAFKRLRRVYGL